MKSPVHLATSLEVGAGARIACDESEAPIAVLLCDCRGGIRTDGEKFATDAGDVTCEQCKAAYQLLLEGQVG